MMKVECDLKKNEITRSIWWGWFCSFFLVFLVCARIKWFFVRLWLVKVQPPNIQYIQGWSHLGSFTKDWTHFLETELSHFSQYLQILICHSLLSMSTGTICLSSFLLGKLLGRLGDTSHQICTFLLGDVTCVLIAFRWLRWSEAWHMEASRWWSWWGGNDGMAWRVCALYWVLWWEEKKEKKERCGWLNDVGRVGA